MSAAAKRKEEVPKPDERRPEKHSKPTAKGLWVNWEFLRSLSRRPPKTALHQEPEEYNRLLQLGDIALRNPAERRKVDKRTLAFRKRDKKANER